jgi:hypothetical protein
MNGRPFFEAFWRKALRVFHSFGRGNSVMPDSCVEVLDIMLPCQRVRCVYTSGITELPLPNEWKTLLRGLLEKGAKVTVQDVQRYYKAS